MRRVREWCGIFWRILWWLPAFVSLLALVLVARIGWGRREAHRVWRDVWGR